MPEENAPGTSEGGDGGGGTGFDVAAWQAALTEAGLTSPEKLKELREQANKAEEWKGHARSWEQRSKENAAKAAAGQTDAEKALTAARQEAETATAQKYGARLARAEWLAAAQGKVAEPADLIEEIRLSDFVDENGEVDESKIRKSVDRWAKLAPAENYEPDPARGARGGGGGTKDMNRLIREAAGR